MSDPPIAAAESEAPRTILVVDDEPAIRALFTRVLRGAGYETLEAADGIEAVELLDTHAVALILLDSTMPRLDGAGVIRAVRARPDTRTLPIILVTARANLEDRVRGLAAGADDYLAKPVALDELEARVHAQLRTHTAWTAAIERDAAQRRAITAALRRVRSEGSAEHVAGALVKELMPVLDIDAAALATVQGDGSLVPLAEAGKWPGQFGSGPSLEPAVARRLLEATAEGPWAIEHDRKPGATASGDGTVAAIRLEGANGTFGLLVIRISARHDDAREIVRRMPLYVEAADLIAAMLGPVLEGDGERRQERAALEGLIRTGAFTPYVQPLVTLADGHVVGYEALTRFHDGTPPDQRFASASRLGLGRDLERATLGAAVEAARALPAGAFLGLNVSPDMVLSGELSPLLSNADRKIVLEITEHTPIDDYPSLRSALAQIRPPARVAVDDAGSGYASLRHILALRPAFVKLDMTWVRGIEADPARQALVAGLVHFASEVGCQLIGEGIETESERRTLLRLGVPLGQGYLLGRPEEVTGRRADARRPQLTSTRSASVGASSSARP
jgi:EAL domain-containing protein (putative c-di-GMP-specific phosphodiesterase class I)/CheY-like chemotaxis protein